MLHATMHIDQILDLFQVRVVLTEFSAGQDPTIWESRLETLELPEHLRDRDALSTLLGIIALWSERTNP